ncbi:hypothetical protein N665_0167s0012 [Sinapis alba]|nr:hypothetical protein N665_0167s0012 [Sinapis alba]
MFRRSLILWKLKSVDGPFETPSLLNPLQKDLRNPNKTFPLSLEKLHFKSNMANLESVKSDSLTKGLVDSEKHNI